MIVPTRCMRSLAISLAVLLASIELTHGFTLSYELVRPHDLVADESRIPEVRHEWKRFVDEAEEFDVAPIVPLQRAVAMPFASPTEAMVAELMTAESAKVTNIYVTPINEISTEMIETTVIPKSQDITNNTASIGLGGNVVDTTPKYNEIDEGTTLLVKELKRVNIETTTTNPIDTTTVITTTDVIVNYLEASVNEEKNNTKDTNGSTPVTSTTAVSANIVEILTESHNTTELSTESIVNATAKPVTAWKKYTEIQRKPVNVTEDEIPHITERIGDSLNAHTTETRVSLEKAFDLAPDILSLQELKTHLMDTTNSIQPKTDVTESYAKTGNILTKDNLKVAAINPTEMVSLRAGYLDHTKSSVDSNNRSTTVNASGGANEVEMEGIAYEMDAHDENEDTQNMTSHSQMVEDALKEELLEEARLVDSIRFHTTSDRPKIAEQIAEQNEIASSDTNHVYQGDNQKQPEDLTVKPINYEKKTLNLYTVSPNYKPRKKIDVQPMKPFMRDPDDNSWRNESLSSLGIVFKGKNSSKAFTEVIKNKTETVMSNLPEQEKTIEKVELRDRLEKIAEKRKSKKKKTDKFGNTEYTDYEENNSGDSHSSKEKPNGNPEIPLTTSTVPPNSTKTVEWVAKGSALDEEMPDADLDKIKANTESPRTSPHDYYDSKDEDADYATFPNIDILKSTPRPRVQWPVTQKILDNTQPNRQYLPDRQPTVQYFPPRPKALQENNNNYEDDAVKQKFNLYGHTIQPKDNVEPTERYTERNPGPYRTEKYVSDENRNRLPIENKNPALQPVHHVEYRPVEGNDDRGNFVIRHYKDLLEQVIKDADYDRNAHPYGAPAAMISDEGKTVKSEEYDYGQRKEELNRFVDNFNQNHERFKVDFPVVFNTSIVHGSESGKVLASSSAMFKRLYNAGSHGESFSFSNRPYDPNCENVTVELSPAYELHYYVPEQEETGDHTMPYGYRT